MSDTAKLLTAAILPLACGIGIGVAHDKTAAKFNVDSMPLPKRLGSHAALGAVGSIIGVLVTIACQAMLDSITDPELRAALDSNK